MLAKEKPVKPVLQLLCLHQFPIYQQLEIEEALLRADDQNWCVINFGTPQKAIVMGISGKPEHHVNSAVFEQAPVPVIRRFSGGGTVFVDANTWFITTICNEQSVGVSAFPQQVLQWNGALLAPFLNPFGFKVQENDYVLGNRKFGGNAQYLQKNRWLHHSSLLWDYDPVHMTYLNMPPKMPQYRDARKHEDFICRLKEVIPSQEWLLTRFLEQMDARFQIQECSLDSVQKILQVPHRKSLSMLQVS